MKQNRNLRQLLKSDRGLSLAEVLVSVGLTGLLALGCTQLALASFTSANYTQSIAVKSLNSGNANRLITSDMENASAFLVPSASVQSLGTGLCTSAGASTFSSGSVNPLLAIQYSNGSEIGYEVRTDNGAGALWRVSCPTGGSASGPELMIRNSLPTASASVWDSSVLCASFPIGGTLQAANCATDAWLTSTSANPGIVFTIPATLPGKSVSVAAQSIVAARNSG